MKEMKFGDHTVRISNQIHDLVKRRYEEVGMVVKEPTSSSMMIECLFEGNVVASATIDFGNIQDFFSYKNFPKTISKFQESGVKLMEMTKFVIDKNQSTRFIMGCMFNMIYKFAVIKNGVTHIFIEAKEEHIAGYKRLLKFDIIDGPIYNSVAQKDVCLMMMDVENKTGLSLK